MSWLSRRLKAFFSSLLGGEGSRFSKVVVQDSVVQDIISFAQANHPKEFAAILQGEVKDEVMTVSGLLYQEFHASSSQALMRMNLPMLSQAVGSVHSHPGFSNRPSRADLQFFGKTGVVHLIVCRPYRQEALACYDYLGNPMEFFVV